MDILTPFSILFAAASTLIGITQKDTWQGKWPTKLGSLAILLLVISSSIQIIQIYQKKKEIGSIEQKLKKATESWISLGSYNIQTKSWECEPKSPCPHLTVMGLSDNFAPDEIKDQTGIFPSPLTGRRWDKSKSCLDINKFQKQPVKIYFGTRVKVKIEDKAIYPEKCQDSNRKRVFLKVYQIMDPNNSLNDDED